ncbi:5-hydroxytryptamine receptor 3A-like isoform X2 [Phyllopteryx taeniolatus]|uniref:5-hydroxytryptamine receptor 3A-like isoform X2 n=1 Tax=Phyllopteryx taeniolatus TaxID=161469 RepID=UPI002AD26C64|nr:5-hydroxytryptamine receptor 3A-like isoform X2 [Phyllopteryx taeniolatus]
MELFHYLCAHMRPSRCCSSTLKTTLPDSSLGRLCLATCFYFLRCSLQSNNRISAPPFQAPRQGLMYVLLQGQWEGIVISGLKRSYSTALHITATMKVLLIVLILSGVGRASPGKVCSYQDVVDHLNLTSRNRAFQFTRPVLDHTRATLVELNIILYAIVGVIEKTQTFIPLLWTMMSWTDERISWDPDEFCGITEISLPTDMLWIPDIIILEMVEKDNSQHNPYMIVKHNGTVLLDQDIRAVSMCMMDVYKFPFDTQRCNISLVSAMFKYEQLRVIPVVNSSRATDSTKAMLHSQGEWEFLHLSVSNNNISFNDQVWEKLVYTFVIKRRPLLHVINFLLPIFFFLCLDLASYFIPDQHGEKLGLKVTMLLAISVLLLILNDILPSVSNKTPLIAMYCIVIFALMLLSLLETIMVTYLTEGPLLEKLARCVRSKRKKDPTDKADTDIQQTRSACPSVSSGEKPHELLPVPQEINSSTLGAESRLLLLVVDELKELQRTLSVHLSCKKDSGKFAHLASKINNVFFFFYLTAVTLFLSLLYLDWKS